MKRGRNNSGRSRRADHRLGNGDRGNGSGRGWIDARVSNTDSRQPPAPSALPPSNSLPPQRLPHPSPITTTQPSFIIVGAARNRHLVTSPHLQSSPGFPPASPTQHCSPPILVAQNSASYISIVGAAAAQRRTNLPQGLSFCTPIDKD